MAQTFNCPQCGGPLEFKGGSSPTMTCPYCHNSVIIPPELRTSGPSQLQGTVTLVELASQSPEFAEMARLLQKRNIIGAIKIFREQYNVGLKEAKDAVEDLAAGRAIVLPTK